MARTSAFAHLKVLVEADFAEGKQPRELYAKYPDVPPRTMRDWYNAFIPQIPPQFSPDAENVQAVGVEVLPPRGNVVGLQSQEQSDMSLARKTLRNICKDKEINPAVRVHAAGYLMRLAVLRHELPKHIIDETEPTAEESLQKLEVEFIDSEAAYTDAKVG